ncbi:hypothetical protein ACF0H5_003987 [Mactra antiquata]
MSTEDESKRKSAWEKSLINTVFNTPDYENIQEKRRLLLRTGLCAGLTLGIFDGLFQTPHSGIDILKKQKILTGLLVFKGTLTGGVSALIYSYSSSELSKYRGNVCDGWNHFYAGAAAALPYAILYQKPLLNTAYGMLIAGSLAAMLRLAMESDLMKHTMPCPENTRLATPTRYPELFMMFEGRKQKQEMKASLK